MCKYIVKITEEAYYRKTKDKAISDGFDFRVKFQ